MDMSQPPQSPVKTVIEPLYKVKGWIKFLGVLSIISGVFQILSCWGIIIAWLPIWMGILLLKAAGGIETGYHAEEELQLAESMRKLGLYFKLLGIFMITLFCLVIVGIIAAIAIPAFMQGMQQAQMG